ncbi:type IX secretion system protein PorG [Pedobacter sandarakinus]|uniref:type IX secretion system protein PorG n=1 Tax=Pedobacter sandarakinus TaxID=353156 RepID=UPI0022458D2B|nr:DUF6089 family protein [Pedobacter sandarakinus]MCX2572917.1 DUF6089 family protein [Pedobacter sandarakinus]
MTLNKRLLFIILLFISNYTITQAQVGNWELGLMAGGAGYLGDLNQNNPLQISGLSAGVYAKRNFNQYIGVRINYQYGQIEAQDAASSNLQFIERNLSFKTSLSELNAVVDFNFFNYKLGGGSRQFTPYLFTGIGGVLFKPTVDFEGETYRLDRLATEGQPSGYQNLVLTIPYGVGLRYNYKDTWSVFSEIGYRTPLTDYIDDVSGRYPAAPVILRNGENTLNLSDPSLSQTGYVGTQRGDFRKRDTYLFVSVGISFTFVSSKCYTF